MDDNANNGSNESNDEFPMGIFKVTINKEALKRMEETAIPFTEEEAELADYNVRKVIKELNKK